MANLPHRPELRSFLTSHCQQRHYSFCVKKCGDETCEVCAAPRLPADVFETLSFLPDPEPEDGTDCYKSFEVRAEL